jgi:hypothetical protein
MINAEPAEPVEALRVLRCTLGCDTRFYRSLCFPPYNRVIYVGVTSTEADIWLRYN